MLVVSESTENSVADGRVCELAEAAREKLEALSGVGRIWSYGMRSRELAVTFDPAALEQDGVSLEALTRAVAEHMRSMPAGMADMAGRRYAMRVEGLNANPDFLADWRLVRQQADCGRAVAPVDFEQYFAVFVDRLNR